MQQDLFGQPLVADPAVALSPLGVVVPFKTGPLHKVQFVIEFVGPRSIPAASAARLMGADWYGALGQPNAWGMRPADLYWQPLTPATDGSYDSLALAWDLITPGGALTSASAQHLLGLAEKFGPFIQRRVIPLPVPAEVNRTVRQLQEIREGLDIGFALSVIANRSEGFAERDLWIQCARMGLEFNDGSFDWRIENFPGPLLSVTPIGDTDAFSLGNVQLGVHHLGATIGFSLPLNPAPTQALDAAFKVAHVLGTALGGTVVDDEQRRINDRLVNELRGNLRQAISMFSQAGMVTGSPETIRLFSIE